MKSKILISSIIISINTYAQTFVEPLFSVPAIEPATSLQSSNPNSKQLDPNKIHLVILGDGYNAYDEISQIFLNDPLMPSVKTLNRFYNAPIGVIEQGLYGSFYSVNLPYNQQGDSQDFIDYMFGDPIRNGAQPGNWSGYTPYKEYKNYFEIYNVLYNSANGNGIGHPYAVDIHNYQLNTTLPLPDVPNCEGITPSCTSPVTIPTPNFENQTATFWSSNLDFCDSHRAISVDYDKINDFLDVYFPNVPVFVVVLINTSEYGGAANINDRTAAIAAAYTRGPIGSYPHFDERGAIHEFSHIFGLLQDEYWFGYDPNLACFSNPLNVTEVEFNTAPNRTNNLYPLSSNLHTWHHWEENYLQVNEPTIGNYNHHIPNCQCASEYSTTTVNYFKPTDNKNCLMEEVVAIKPFCAVCREAIIERIHSLVNPINSTSPSTNNGDIFPISSSHNFEVNLTIPERTDLSNHFSSMIVKWSILDETGTTEYASLQLESPSVTPVNPASAIYKFTDPTHSSICDWFNGREAGNYKVKVEVYDRAGASENLSDNTRWVRDPDHVVHKYSVIWNVNYTGIAGIDLYSSDSELDSGSEPSYVADVNWESNDIWVTNSTNQDGLVHENPVYSTTASPFVHTWVKNRGCKVFDPAVDNANVKMYWSKATTMLDWPTSWDGSTTFSGGSNPYKGNLINTVSINETVDIASPGGVKVNFTWANFPDPTSYDFFGVNDMLHFCLLSRIESTFDPMTNEVAGNTYFNVRNNNNIVQKNITVIDDDIIGGSTGDGFTDDRVTGAAVLVSNSSASSQTVKFKFQVPNEETGKPITEEAQVRIILSDTLWQRWIRGGSQGSGVSVYNASRHQIRLTSDDASLSNIQIDTAEFEPLYVSVNFLTQERSSKELFTLRVLHTLEDSTSTILGGETYLIKPDPYRTSFSADAGNDKELLVGTTWNQSAKTLTETAIYNWYNSSGTKIHSGATLSDTTTTVSSETYTLEVIAQSDGYKDYDEVTITSKLGKINSIIPNPINSGTFTIDYSVSTSASSPKIKVLNINSGIFTEHTISTGNGTLSLAISGYSAGSYSVILICSSQNADDELLIIQ